MRRHQFLATLFAAGSLLLAAGTLPAQDATPKKRIAVLNFDGPSGPSGTSSALPAFDAGDIGKGVSVQLIEKLVHGGKYTVVDRSALEQLLKEQKDADSNSMDAYALAAKIGRLLGLDAMMIGAVTRYGPGDSGKATAGGAPQHSGTRTRQAKAHVEIIAKVFNVGTGAVMAEITGTGESEHTGTITTVTAGGHGQPKTAFDVLGSEFVGSLLGEATRNAVDQIATQLNAFADKIPSTPKDNHE